jgi:hypothetical protein
MVSERSGKFTMLTIMPDRHQQIEAGVEHRQQLSIISNACGIVGDDHPRLLPFGPVVMSRSQ